MVSIAGSMHAFFNDFLPHCQREIFRLEFVGYVRAFELLSWHHGRSCGDSSSLGGPHEMGVRRDHLDSPAVVICDLFPSFDHRRPAARLWAAVRRTRVINKQDVRVWIVKRSGFYYCSDSTVYGKLRPGAYMRQGEALQRGYQPFFQRVCR